VSPPVDNWVLSGRYGIGDRLGSGGAAEVYRAHDELLDRDVAVKVFRDPRSDDDELHSSARREAELQSLAQLNHPNLIRLLDGAIGPDEPAYLVLDLVDGPDLAARLHDGPLPEAEVRAIGGQIASALDYAHGMGLVHRDVKPANVLLGTDGPDGEVWARLSDFGTVRMVDATRMTAADLTVGTASYIAPEQARGSDVGPPADVYSLGLVLIEALTGQRCFEGTTYEAVAARVASTPDVPDSLPADLVALLTAMTAVEPDRRPTAAVVAECLPAAVPPLDTEAPLDTAAPLGTEAPLVVAADVAAAGDVAVEPAVVAPTAEPTPVRHRSRILVALAGIAFAAMLSGAAFLLMDNNASGDGPTPPIGTHHPAAPTTSPHHPRTKEAGAEVVTRPSATHSSTPAQVPLRTAVRTASRTTSSAPVRTSSSAPPSSTASSSAPPSTSPAPTTSPAQTTSPAATP
jgi:serine/threonine protein kinase